MRCSLSAPTSTKCRTTSRCPFWAARCNGAILSCCLSFSSILAPASSNSCRLSTCPIDDAECNGVLPYYAVFVSHIRIQRAFQQLLYFDQIIVGNRGEQLFISLALFGIKWTKFQYHQVYLHGIWSKNFLIRDLATICWKESLPKSCNTHPSCQGLLHRFCSSSFEFTRDKDCQLYTRNKEAHLHREAAG